MADSIAARFADRTVLITGGLGFIGSNLAIRLAQAGSRVTLVDSLIPEYGGNLCNIEGNEGRLRVNVSDVRDVYSLRHLVRGQDYLFNLAGQTSHLDSMRDPFADLEINARAQLSILETCRDVNPTIRIVYAGTRQIYGRPDALPVSETHPIRPVDINGIHKVAGEWYHDLYWQVYGIPACTLRLTNTYGPRMRIKDARQTFVGVWVRRVLEGQPFEVWGGDQLRDFTYVDDAVDALMLAATEDAAVGRSFNLGGCEVLSLRELAAQLTALVPGARFEIKDFPEERRKIDIGDYYSDDAAIRTTLGWTPRVAVGEGLARTLDYFRPLLDRYL